MDIASTRRAFSHWVNRLEEGVISLLLAAMTLLTFSQVIARYVFNSGVVWALEATTTLFAWLILFGISYGIKQNAHLGVDVVVSLLPRKWQRFCAVLAAFCCVLYAVILLDAGFLKIFGDEVNARGGAILYVQKMYSIGIEMEDLPIQRWLVYLILPLGLALFALRSVQAMWLIIRGQRSCIAVVHDGQHGKS